jgi:aryl-alcohol dehydrogenase-like predicted oxidoreductase
VQTAVTRSAAAINISYGLPGDSTMLTGTLAADLDHRGVAITASDAAQLAEARDIAPVAAVQNAYHVQAADDALLAECTRTGIAFVPFFPLGGGFDPIDTARFEKTAARHGRPSSRSRSPRCWPPPR